MVTCTLIWPAPISHLPHTHTHTHAPVHLLLRPRLEGLEWQRISYINIILLDWKKGGHFTYRCMKTPKTWSALFLVDMNYFDKEVKTRQKPIVRKHMLLFPPLRTQVRMTWASIKAHFSKNALWTGTGWTWRWTVILLSGDGASFSLKVQKKVTSKGPSQRCPSGPLHFNTSVIIASVLISFPASTARRVLPLSFLSLTWLHVLSALSCPSDDKGRTIIALGGSSRW